MNGEKRGVSTHNTRSQAFRQRLVGTVMAGALLIGGGGSVAHGALTTPACLAKKLKERGTLRKCQALENGKALQGKPADPAKCQTKLNDKLAKISTQATGAAIACRYRDNGDGTVTDFDTGLMWEQKNSPDGIAYFPNPHDVDNLYDWSATAFLADGQIVTEFLSRLNGSAPALFGLLPCVSADGAVTGGFANHCDWRLPSIVELAGIVDTNALGCGFGNPCIDPIFGRTYAKPYWSATGADAGITAPGYPLLAEIVDFHDGSVQYLPKVNAPQYGSNFHPNFVRAVRSDS